MLGTLECREPISYRIAAGLLTGAQSRPPAFDREEYKRRNLVERCFNRFKQFRDLATRYAKRAAYYTSEIIIASLVLRLR